MELGYVVKAVRRYWPVVVIVGVLGLVAGSVLALDREPQYESTGSVLVAPTTNGGFSGLPGDRFVMSQLVVFESPRLTSRALELAEVDLTPFEAREAVTFEQVTGTDVVMVTTSAAAPETAQALTNGYIDAYFEELQNRVESNDLGPELEALDRSIDEIVDQIRLVDQQIADVLAPFLLPVVDDGDGVQPPGRFRRSPRSRRPWRPNARSSVSATPNICADAPSCSSRRDRRSKVRSCNGPSCRPSRSIRRPGFWRW